MKKRKFLWAALLGCLAVGWAGAAWAGPYEEGMSLFNSGNYQTAAQRFRTAVEENPANVEAMKRLGDCYFNIYSEAHPDYGKIAIEAYSKALEIDPKDGVTRLHLAQIYSWTNDTDDAIKQLQTLLANEPENTLAMVELAEIYSWKPDTYKQALEQCEAVVKKEPKNKRAHMIAGRVYSWLGEHPQSLQHYSAALDVDPNDNKLRLEYANELSMAGKYNEAIEQFNYLTSRHETADQSLVGLAQAYYNSRRYADAMAVVEIVLKREPKNGYAWRLKGLILHDQRRYVEAADAFKKALEINPDDIEAKLLLAETYAVTEATYPEAVAAYRDVLRSQPDNAKVLTDLARIYGESNNFPLAIEQYRLILAKDPDNFETRTALVRTLIKAKSYEEAVREARALMQKSPDKIEAKVLFGETLLEAGRFEDALAVYEDAVKAKPQYLPAAVGLGWAHHAYSMDRIAQGQKLQETIKKQTFGIIDRIHYLWVEASETWHFNRAVTVLTEAATKFPDATEPHLKLAEVYAQHKAYKSSIESYEKALQIDPRSVPAYLGMAWVYAQMGNSQKSIDAIRRAAQIEPTNADVLGSLGDAYAYQQDVSQAIEALEKAVTMKFTDLELHRRLANLYAQNRKYYDKAIRECQFILEHDAADDDTRRLLARVYSWKEQYDDSVKVYEELVARRPQDQDLYLEMMKTKMYSGKSDEVIAELRVLLTKEPDNVNARLALGNAYEAHSDLELADKEFTTVLKTDPKNGNAHLGLATVYREKEQFDHAVVEYREVLATNPDSAEAYYGLGVIDRRAGHYERAIAMQKKVLELDSSNLNAFAELSYNHYLLARRYVATTGQYQRAWWLLSNNWGDIYGVWGEYPASVEQMRAILLDDPGNCDLRYLLAQELQNHNRNKEAVAEFRKLLSYCPNHIGARVALADIFSYSPSTYAWAVTETLEIVKREPDNYDAHLRLARLYSWSLQYTASINQYLWCLKIHPDAVDVRQELAQTLSYSKMYKESLTQYEIVLAQDPSRNDVRIEMAKVFSYENRNDEAIRQYEVILQRDPNNFEASFALANLYSWDRRYYHRAIDLYRKLFLKYPKNVESRMEYGRLLYERGEFKDAEEAYRNAVELEPDNADAHLMLGRIYVAKHQSDKAVDEFNQVLQVRPNDVDAHYYLTSIYSSDEKTWPQAIDHGLAVLAIEPNNDEVRELVARVYASMDDHAKAAKHYAVLVENNPNDDELRYQYALSLSYAEDYSEAVEQFQKLALKKPEDVPIRLEMGLAMSALGQYTDAIVNLEFAVGRDPWNVRARKGLANSYKNASKVDAAINQYKRILVIDPNDKEAREFLKLYGIEYNDVAFLDQWFNSPGKTMLAGGPPTGPPGVDDAEVRYRLRLADELARHSRYKQARYVYEDLVRKDPANLYYRLALANIYIQSGMYASARLQFQVVLRLDPDNAEAKTGLAEVAWLSAPRLATTAEFDDIHRFSRTNTMLALGSRFTYLFGDGGEAFGELVAARHAEQHEVHIDRLSPRVGAAYDVFGEVTLRGEYAPNIYSRLPTTHNWLGSVTTDIYDYVGLEGYYDRTDVRQTILAMEQHVASTDLGGVLRVSPLAELNLRGEYRHSWLGGGSLVRPNQSDLASGAAAYTFFKGPYFTPGYVYTWQIFDDETPNVLGVYFAPRRFQSHGLTFDVRDQVGQSLVWDVGVSPAYNILGSDIQKTQTEWTLSAYGGVDWLITLNHRLAAQVSGGADVSTNTFYEYSLVLTYTYIFGKFKGEWLQQRATETEP
jgi:tetratricopeptide (TPR) repeat protein